MTMERRINIPFVSGLISALCAAASLALSLWAQNKSESLSNLNWLLAAILWARHTRD